MSDKTLPKCFRFMKWQHLDELFTLLAIVFAFLMAAQNYMLNQNLREINTQHDDAIEKFHLQIATSNKIATERLSIINRLETRIAQLSQTIDSQNKTLLSLSKRLDLPQNEVRGE